MTKPSSECNSTLYYLLKEIAINDGVKIWITQGSIFAANLQELSTLIGSLLTSSV